MQVLKDIAPIRIDKTFEIPSIPLMLIKIIQVLDENKASAQELEMLILHDPSLSARILRLANSAFYSFRNEVKTISHAITLLGISLVTSLAIGINVFDSFTKGMKSQAVLINKLWMHSCGVGVFAKEIWTRRSSKKEGEFAFLCGLLHDLGKVVFFKTYPAHYSSVFAAKKSDEDPAISEYEVEYYGADHATVGEMLAKQWSLPPELAFVIRKHHDALAVDISLVSAVALADLLAKRLGIGHDGDNNANIDIDKLQSKLKMSAEEYERLTVFASHERSHIEEFFQMSSC